jgi:hypothetical protein
MAWRVACATTARRRDIDVGAALFELEVGGRQLLQPNPVRVLVSPSLAWLVTIMRIRFGVAMDLLLLLAPFLGATRI